MPVHRGPPPIDMYVPLSATLIYDGADEPRLPRQLLPKVDAGSPPDMPLGERMAAGTMEAYDKAKGMIAAAGQLIGTPLEQLCEIAGRNCYDSFGRGRNSADFHKHILEVGHLSVLEHAAFTMRFEHADKVRNPQMLERIAILFLNKPAVHVRLCHLPDGSYVQVTLNLRHVLEWPKPGPVSRVYEKDVLWLLRDVAHYLAPAIVAAPGWGRDAVTLCGGPIDPLVDEQKWVTLLLTGSRGFSHELVRHGDWTAISQRSTRYVDESDSHWVTHPLSNAYHADPEIQGTSHQVECEGQEVRVLDGAREMYRDEVARLEPWLIARGVDKVTARKQARGAARGYLGNALYTEVVFSASVSQWKHMLRQRLSPFADAEIREVFRQVLIELKNSRYTSSFEGWTTKPSPDGIGEVLVEPTTSTP